MQVGLEYIYKTAFTRYKRYFTDFWYRVIIFRSPFAFCLNFYQRTNHPVFESKDNKRLFSKFLSKFSCHSLAIESSKISSSFFQLKSLIYKHSKAFDSFWTGITLSLDKVEKI